MMISTETARKEAETAIRRILLALESDHGVKIDEVRVDTRTWENFRTEIFFEGEF